MSDESWYSGLVPFETGKWPYVLKFTSVVLSNIVQRRELLPGRLLLATIRFRQTDQDSAIKSNSEPAQQKSLNPILY